MYIYIYHIKIIYGISYCPLKGSRSKIEVSDLRFIKIHFMVESWRFKEQGVAGYWRFKSKVLHRSMDQCWWSKSKSEYAIFVQFLFFIVYCWRFKDWRFEGCGFKDCWMLKVECWRLQDWQRTVPTWGLMSIMYPLNTTTRFLNGTDHGGVHRPSVNHAMAQWTCRNVASERPSTLRYFGSSQAWQFQKKTTHGIFRTIACSYRPAKKYGIIK